MQAVAGHMAGQLAPLAQLRGLTLTVKGEDGGTAAGELSALRELVLELSHDPPPLAQVAGQVAGVLPHCLVQRDVRV